MEIVLSKILSQIRHQEDDLSSQMMRTADEAYQMTLFLNEMLGSIKAKVLQDNFVDEQQEIDFFKNIKPQVLGKLIYYNKVFRIGRKELQYFFRFREYILPEKAYRFAVS